MADNKTMNIGKSGSTVEMNVTGHIKQNNTQVSLEGHTHDEYLNKTVSSSGSGNAVTDVSASNGALTVTKGDTFVNLTSTQTLQNKIIQGGYLNIHPENTPAIIPFINNDIAFLIQRGGSVELYKDNVLQNNNSYNINNMFDGSPSYCNISSSGVTSVTLILNLPLSFGWSSVFYIDFGNAGWRAKDVSVDVYNSNFENDIWTNKINVSNNANGHIRGGINHTPVGGTNAGNGFNKIRIVLKNFNSTDFRIAQIGVMNYGSSGVRNTYMSRGIDDGVWRNITPDINNFYNLGTSSKKWASVYATNFNGNAAKLQTYKQGSTSETYGASYPVYAQWKDNTHVRLKCDNYTVETDYADNAGKVNNHTINADVPSNAVFTDTKDWASITGKPTLSTVATSGSYNDLSNKPTIPSAVTESTVSGWGFTKNTDTKNTAGSTDTSSKIFLVGATSQAANPQTYSDNQVYATNGQLDANKVRIAEAVSLVYDSTNKCLNFNFT